MLTAVIAALFMSCSKDETPTREEETKTYTQLVYEDKQERDMSCWTFSKEIQMRRYGSQWFIINEGDSFLVGNNSVYLGSGTLPEAKITIFGSKGQVIEEVTFKTETKVNSRVFRFLMSLEELDVRDWQISIENSGYSVMLENIFVDIDGRIQNVNGTFLGEPTGCYNDEWCSTTAFFEVQDIEEMKVEFTKHIEYHDNCDF